MTAPGLEAIIVASEGHRVGLLMALEHEVLRPDGPIVGRPWLDQGVVLPTADRGSARLPALWMVGRSGTLARVSGAEPKAKEIGWW